MENFRFVEKSSIGAQLLVKDNAWQYKQLLGPHYWKEPLKSLFKNISAKANFIKFSKNCQFDLNLQKSTVIVK